MIYSLLDSQEKLLDIAQKTKDIDLVNHILETTFYYKGFGFVQVSDVKEASIILNKYINTNDISLNDFLLTQAQNLNRISKTFHFSDDDFKDFLTDLFLSDNVKLINVAFFLDDHVSLY